MISAIDDVVGDLWNTLNHTDQLQRTLLIWSSDNGAPGGVRLSPHDGGPSKTGGRTGYSVRNWPLKVNYQILQ